MNILCSFFGISVQRYFGSFIICILANCDVISKIIYLIYVIIVI